MLMRLCACICVVLLAGVRMDQVAVTAALNACLVTDAEFALGLEGWASYEDPFAELAVPAGDADEDDGAQDGEDEGDDEGSEADGDLTAVDPSEEGHRTGTEPEGAPSEVPAKSTLRFLRCGSSMPIP